MSGGPNYLDSLAGPAFPTMTITRWHWSEWPRLVRGQCVTAQGRYWRVTDVHADLSGNETYSLEPGEVVDARIEYERKQRRSSSSLPKDPYRQEAVQDEPTRCWSGP